MLSAARAAGDAAARAGAIYCLAAVAHRAGGRMLRASPPPGASGTASNGPSGADAIETLLDLLSRRVDEGAAAEVEGDRLNALAALQCAAADPLTVRRVARRLEVVQASWVRVRVRVRFRVRVRVRCRLRVRVRVRAGACSSLLINRMPRPSAW